MTSHEEGENDTNGEEFFIQTMQVRKKSQTCSVLKELLMWILYSKKISFGKIKKFSDEWKERESVTNTSTLT